MSVKVMNWVWESSRTVGNDRLVLLAIADRASDEGLDAWPSIKTLARKTRLHERTVQRCIGAIEHLGELEVRRKDGPHGTNIYAVKMDTLILQDSSRPNRRKRVREDNLPPGGILSPGGDRATRLVAALSPPGGASATGEVAALSPDSSGTPRTTRTSLSNTALARDPNADGNYRVIERLAFELASQGWWTYGDERYSIETEADLVCAVKDTAALHSIDYGNHPDVAVDIVHRACASEWFKRAHRRTVGRKEPA